MVDERRAGPDWPLVAVGVLLVVVAGLVLLPAVFVVLTDGVIGSGGAMGTTVPTGMSGMPDPGMMGPGMMAQAGAAAPAWLGPASWLLVAVGAVLLAVWAIRRLRARSSGADATPLALLRRRYARGRVSSGRGQEESERVRADLLRDREG